MDEMDGLLDPSPSRHRKLRRASSAPRCRAELDIAGLDTPPPSAMIGDRGNAMTQRYGIVLRLSAFEGADTEAARPHGPEMEFHVRRTVRAEHKLEEALFSLSGNVVFPNFYASRVLARIPERPTLRTGPPGALRRRQAA
ncbi:MAG: hypothetical protein MZV64_09570 [Ignavibacteriales bacterium]|nr:hypothetical protein [Ignavibacteriales bacterium]